MSEEGSLHWSAGVHIYSGRRDPVWSVAAADVAAALRIWDALAPSAARDLPSRLGYRGCWLRAPDGRRWTAAEGFVSVAAPGGSPETRTDVARGFERYVLATAPPGLLPHGVGPAGG